MGFRGSLVRIQSPRPKNTKKNGRSLRGGRPFSRLGSTWVARRQSLPLPRLTVFELRHATVGYLDAAVRAAVEDGLWDDGVQPPAQPVGCNALFYGRSATDES